MGAREYAMSDVDKEKSNSNREAEGSPFEADFAHLVHTCPVMIGILDGEGQIQFVNDAMGSAVEFQPEELVGTSFLARLHPDDRTLMEGVLHASDKPVQETHIACRFLTRASEYKKLNWVIKGDVYTGLVHVVGFSDGIYNAVERMRIEEELRASHQQIASILDTTVDGIITISEKGSIRSFNKAAERLFGYEAEEVIGKNVKMLMPSPYREEHDGYLGNYLRTGNPRIIGIGREVTGLRSDGSLFPMELAVSEIQGKRRIFTGIVRDISTRRAMQREILQVGEFERQRIGRELHDGLGSQLTAIGMICQSLAKRMAREGSELAETVHEIGMQIKEADYQARNLSRGLIPVAAEPNGLVTALRRLISYIEGSGISGEIVVTGDVHLDDSIASTHLYRIAQEAVTNAMRHSRATRIAIHLTAFEETGDMQLDVIDNGIGLPEKMEDTGGIGMRTMYYRANMLGADLLVDSAKEKGTVISCLLGRRELEAFNH